MLPGSLAGTIVQWILFAFINIIFIGATLRHSCFLLQQKRSSSQDGDMGLEAQSSFIIDEQLDSKLDSLADTVLEEEESQPAGEASYVPEPVMQARNQVESFQEK